MSDFGSPISGSVFTTGLNSGTANTVFPTPDAAAHTLGPWTDLATPGRTGGVALTWNWGQDTATHRTVMVDLAVGSAGAEKVLVSDLLLAYSGAGITGSRAHQQTILLPITLPPGGLIRARCRASIASVASIQLNLLSAYNCPSPWTGSLIDTYGAVPASTSGTTMTADNADRVMGAYAEVTPSCNRMECFFVAVVATSAQTGFNNQSSFWELAVGAAGQEKLIAAGGCGASSATGITTPQIFGPFYQQIAPGQRLSARCAKQGTTTQRTLDIVVYGVR